ncbi:MAG: hydrogenase maturation nickel metallochaperone HypA [Candidatus Thermoplasmatota archaeon]|nr:hydrogenase maturation nickel metallochaperone HypA [Candidatus Thermoplasmatota archaeon]
MHEFSVMSQIVDSILEEAKKRDARKIEQVDLEIGDYTMLGHEQMRFAFDVLAKDTILEGAELNITTRPGRVECSCGYEGSPSVSEDSPHKVVPILECPKCGGVAKIVAGRECIIRNIRLVVPDV